MRAATGTAAASGRPEDTAAPMSLSSPAVRPNITPDVAPRIAACGFGRLANRLEVRSTTTAVATPARTIKAAGAGEGSAVAGTGFTPHMKVASPATVMSTARTSRQVGMVRSRAARMGTAITTPTSIIGCTRAMDPSLRAVACSSSAENEIVVASSQSGLRTTWASTPSAWWATLAGTVPATRCCSALEAANPSAENRQINAARGALPLVI